MATPIDRGATDRGYSIANVDSPIFTPAADSLMLCWVVVKSATGNAADSISGHDGGTPWVLIDSTLSSGNISVGLYGAHSGASPSSGVISVARVASNRMQCNYAEITGADVSGTVANSFIQTMSNTGYGSPIIMSLPGATLLTIACWGEMGFTAGSPDAPEVVLNGGKHSSTNQSAFISFDSAGNTAPTYTMFGGTPRYYDAIALEIKDAGGAGITAFGNLQATDSELDSTVDIIISTSGNLQSTDSELDGTSNLLILPTGNLLSGDSELDGAANLIINVIGNLQASDSVMTGAADAGAPFNVTGDLQASDSELDGIAGITQSLSGNLQSGDSELAASVNVIVEATGNLQSNDSELDGVAVADSEIVTTSGNLQSGDSSLDGSANIQVIASGDLVSGNSDLQGAANQVIIALGNLQSSNSLMFGFTIPDVDTPTNRRAGVESSNRRAAVIASPSRRASVEE